MTIGNRVERAVKSTLAVVSRCGRYFSLEFEREGISAKGKITHKKYLVPCDVRVCKLSKVCLNVCPAELQHQRAPAVDFPIQLTV